MATTAATKQAIREAFLGLLTERPLNKIKVKDITDICGINRNTFYYHYQDIPALLEDICALEVDKLVKEYPTIHSMEESTMAAMRFGLEYRKAVLHIYYSDNRSTYVQCLWRMCENSVRTYLDSTFPDAAISEKDRALLVRYMKCEIFGIVIDWVSTGMKEDYMQDLHRIFLLKKGTVETMIRRCQSETTWE